MQYKILFVCHGNICRSVMAEAILKNKICQKISHNEIFEIDSAATSTEEIGKDTYYKAQEVIKSHLGISFHHVARQIKFSDLEKFDDILIMDQENYEGLIYLFGESLNKYQNKIKYLGSYLPQEKEIFDPWYNNHFEDCYTIIEEAVNNFLDKLLNDIYSSYVAKYIDEHQVIGSVSLISNKNNIIVSSYTGYQDRKNNIRTSKNTIYKVASISKVIVALGIMKLYEEGLICLDEDISIYLGFKVRNPYYPDDIITIKHLMTQTSSLNDVGDGDLGYYGNKAGIDDISLEDLLINKTSKYYCDGVWLDKKPGTYWNYCNFGCGILVCIIELVSKMYFADFIKKYLFIPLNINAGFKMEEFNHHENIAVHYKTNNNDFVAYRDASSFREHQSKVFAKGHNFSGFAGGLYITANDLSKIMMMLMNDGKYLDTILFKKETIQKMKCVHWSGISYDNAYRKKGLQLIILENYDDAALYGHFGNAYGLRGFMLFNNDIGYIFISNGAFYLGDEDHLPKLLDEILKLMIKYKKELGVK